MGLRANKKINSSIVENEIKHIRNIEAIVKKTVTHIDKEIDNIGFLEEDPDYTPFEKATVEFSHLEIRIWIDIEVQNDLCRVGLIDIKDNNDNDYFYLSKMLNQDLVKHYNKESIQRADLFNQALEIQHDQNDPHNLRPKMPSGYGINSKYIQDLKSICEEDETKIILFLKHGYAGSRLTMKPKVKPAHAVRTILPMVFNNVFEQVTLLSSRQDIARFIYDNFEAYNGKTLNYRTIENNISKNYFAC